MCFSPAAVYVTPLRGIYVIWRTWATYNPAPRWLPGLNVPLQNFQSQTLQSAIDQEREDGGLYRQLFAPLLDRNGEEMEIMYSSFMGVIHNEP